MKNLEKIKAALAPLQHINGVMGCWLEEEEGDIVHVHTVPQTVDYDLDQRIFQHYTDIERQFPEVSFEFLITSHDPSPQAEVVFFFSPLSSSPVAEAAVS